MLVISSYSTCGKSVFSRQVVLANKGDIDAVFSYIHSQSMFGPLFKFSPSQGIVRPGGYQAVKVCSSVSKQEIHKHFFFFTTTRKQNV